MISLNCDSQKCMPSFKDTGVNSLEATAYFHLSGNTVELSICWTACTNSLAVQFSHDCSVTMPHHCKTDFQYSDWKKVWHEMYVEWEMAVSTVIPVFIVMEHLIQNSSEAEIMLAIIVLSNLCAWLFKWLLSCKQNYYVFLGASW